MDEKRLQELQDREARIKKLRVLERVAKENIANEKGGRSKIRAAVRGVRVVLRR